MDREVSLSSRSINMSFNLTIRVLGMVLFAAVGLLLGLYLAQVLYGSPEKGWGDIILYLVLGGAIVGFIVTPFITVYPLAAARARLKAVPALDLVAGTVGLGAGLLLG